MNNSVNVISEVRLPGVVAGFNDDDVRAEVRTEQESDCPDEVGLLGLPSRQGQLRELLVGLQHHQVGSKDDSRLLGAVVVDLNGSIVRNLKNKEMLDEWPTSIALKMSFISKLLLKCSRNAIEIHNLLNSITIMTRHRRGI